MARLIHCFKFDVKLLRLSYSFPFAAYALCVFLMLSAGTRSDDPFLPYIFLQGIAVPMAGWHLLFLYSSLYEKGAEETLLFYYRRMLPVDIIRYMLVHGLLVSLLAGLAAWINGPDFFSGTILVHLAMLFIFYQIIGVALLSATNSLDVTIGIIVSYTFMEVVTQGTFMPWPHLFLFEEPFHAFWLRLTFVSLGVGILYAIVQLWWKFN
ncbi:hypothetical protein [Siminovitchia sp. 179-K 8D1 HS]|uniref:hypothetical protein n=1 Tax=Siminovitchia sp. 179-K 8D1 HS TaxID=3142385 RepID=UPI0039A07725